VYGWCPGSPGRHRAAFGWHPGGRDRDPLAYGGCPGVPGTASARVRRMFRCLHGRASTRRNRDPSPVGGIPRRYAGRSRPKEHSMPMPMAREPRKPASGAI
jgi:hypothetical protein